VPESENSGMATIYIIGAGFSKTCGIATDAEMLDALNPLLPRETPKIGPSITAIESVLDQNFRGQENVPFELFMSTVSALKFTSEFLGGGRNIFEEDEKEVRAALIKYLNCAVGNVDWENQGKPILEFMLTVDWNSDYILTFNYDLLIEEAAKKLSINVNDRVIHLHGAINEPELAWPTYTKFADNATKVPLGPRWKRAFGLLRDHTNIDEMVFIGYSMPNTDLEAKGTFNYVDWYNHDSLTSMTLENGKIVPNTKAYSYNIIVVNPADNIKNNYGFFRKKPIFYQLTLENWLDRKKQDENERGII
jgi:hypothetical protein